MVVITYIKKWILRYSLKAQLKSEYFDSSSIKFLNEISIDDRTLLFFYSAKTPFSLGAVLLNNQDTKAILWKSTEPIWRTCEKIKPVKIMKNDNIFTFHFKVNKQKFFYNFSLNGLLSHQKKRIPSVFEKMAENPILKPIKEHAWESVLVFNPAVLFLDGKVHFIYRAVGDTGMSVLGYASSSDGIHIDERLTEPVYVSQNPMARRIDNLKPFPYMSGGSWCGCEDPRLVKIDNTIYMTYTAFDGYHAPCVVLTSISVDDFLHKRWNWKNPVLISPPGEMHKNWVIFPEMLNGQYAILHSITPDILIDYFDNLNFDGTTHIKSYYRSYGREMFWDNWVRGVGPPPIKTEEGWLVLYHAMDKRDPNRYKIGALILDGNDPTKILYRSANPLIEPDEKYENEGHKAGVVYSCGAIIKDEYLYVYYGGADTVVCAARANLKDLLMQIKKCSINHVGSRMSISLTD